MSRRRRPTRAQLTDSESKALGRRALANARATALAGMSAYAVALALHHGYIEQWPFELTRLGRRSRYWTELIDEYAAKIDPDQAGT